MNFSLLAPAALGLLGLALGPILAHLTRQQIREERAFGATLLLERLRSRLERRRRLSDRALLVLRGVALLLLLSALAQPELRWPEPDADLGGTGRVIVVLDDSLSMDQRVGGPAGASQTAFEAARAAASSALRGVPNGTRVAAVRIAPPEVLAGWSDGVAGDGAALASVIEGLARQDGAGDLHGALVLARGLMAGAPAEVVIFTDEAGPGQVEACDVDIERIFAVGGAIVPRPFAPEAPANVVVTDASYGDGLEGGTVSVLLASFGAEPLEVTTTLKLPGGEVLTSFVSVAGATEIGAGTAEARFTVPRQAEGGVATVTVADPALPADNVRSFHLPRIGASRVLVVDGDPGSTPTKSETYFLERALAPIGLGRPAVDVIAPAGMSILDPQIHRVVWLANVADPAPMVPRLLDFVRRGGGLVIGMGDNVTPDRYNTAMETLLPLPLRKVRDLATDPGVPLELAVSSPLLAPFERIPGAFSSITARRAMTVEGAAAGATELLRWEGGVPALVERTVGTGTVLLWTGTFDLGWGNFPIQATFPAFVDRVTSVLGGETAGAGRAEAGVVGEEVSVAVSADAPELSLIGPNGKLRAAARASTELRFVPDLAGEWRVTAGADDAVAVAVVAVNTPVSESDVRRTSSISGREAALAPDSVMVHFALSPHFASSGAFLLLVAASVSVWLARRDRAGEAENAPS